MTLPFCVRVGLIALFVVMINALPAPCAKPETIKPISEFTLSATGVGVTFSPDRRMLAVGFKQGKIDLIVTHNGKPLFTLDSKQYWPSHLKFSDDGAILFCGSGTGIIDGRRKFDVWRLSDRKLLTDSPKGSDRKENAEVIRDAGDGDLSPDGNTMLLGCYRASLAAIDLVAGRITHVNPEFPPLRRLPMSLEFFPDGKQIAMLALDPGFAPGGEEHDEGASLLVLSFPDLKLKASYPLNTRCHYSGLLGGRLTSTAPHDKTYRLYDLRTNEMIADTQVDWDVVEEVVMSLDGKHIAVAYNAARVPGGRRVRILNLGNRVSILECDCHNTESMAFSRDGTLLAVTTKRKSLTLWSTQ